MTRDEALQRFDGAWREYIAYRGELRETMADMILAAVASEGSSAPSNPAFLMGLRDDQREAAYQGMMQTLTRQLVAATTGFEERLERLETLLVDIARKLDA